jgi:hypothetical protein
MRRYKSIKLMAEKRIAEVRAEGNLSGQTAGIAMSVGLSCQTRWERP